MSAVSIQPCGAVLSTRLDTTDASMDPVLTASALKVLGGWLGKKIFDQEIWDRARNQIRKLKLRRQWESALQAAAERVRQRYSAVSIELFDPDFLASVIAPASDAMMGPAAAPDISSVAADFRAHLQTLKGAPGFSPALFQRAEADIDAAVALFFSALEDELAHYSELVPVWRDRSMEAIKRGVERLEAASAKAQANPIHTDRALEAETARMLARRYFPGQQLNEEVVSLAEGIQSGQFAAASAAPKAKTLRLCCRLLARSHLAMAKACLTAARTFGANDTLVEEAWIVFAEGDSDGALKLLRDLSTPDAKAAMFAMLQGHDGLEAAADWVRDKIDPATWSGPQLAGATLTFALLQRWTDVETIVAKLRAEHYAVCPVFHLFKGATLARSIATPHSEDYLLGAALPLSPHHLLTQSRSDWQDAAREAVSAYDRAADAARAIGLSDEARRFAELALWISFETPSLKNDATRRTLEALQDRATALDVVPFANAHGVPVPTEKLRALLAEREALGGLDATDVRAAIALAEGPAEVVALVERRRADIENVLGRSQTRVLEIEAALRGLGADDARRRFETLQADLDEADRAKVAAFLAEDDEKSAALLALYEQSKQPMDLRNLVRHLASLKQWSAAADRARQVFEATRLTPDAEMFCDALIHADRLDELPAFLDAHWDKLDHTPALKSHGAMALLQQSRLSEARALLEELLAGDAGPREEQLYSNVLIESGDWDSLAGLVDRIWRHRNERSSEHLVWAARAASILDLKARALELVREAAARPNASGEVFTGAAQLVFETGQDDDAPELGHWFRRAVELSNEEGPIRQVDVETIVKDAPEWRKRESNIVEALYGGQMPLFIGVRGLGGSLGDLILGNALRSQSITDGRRRSVVPTRFGGRPPQPLQLTGRIVLDITSIFVLEAIGLLGRVLNAGLDLTIPAGTLNVLFLERQKARFHQPSRIAEAEHVMALIAQQRLERAPVSAASLELASAVGDELAQLAFFARSEGALLVRPPPISKPGDFSERPADVSAFEGILTDTCSVFSMLRNENRLSGLAEAKAAAYLPRQDRGWPKPAVVKKDTALVLDGLALHYLYAAGLLDPLTKTGARIFVHPNDVQDALTLVEHKASLQDYFLHIEAARTSLRDAIKDERIKLAPRRGNDGDDELPVHPTMELLQLAEADWVIIDDRALNVHGRTSPPAPASPVLVATSFDLIAALVKAEVITEPDARHARHLMRESGFFFVPLMPAELDAELSAAAIADGALVETRYLRVAREALLRLATVDALKLESEGAVLDAGYRAACLALFQTWRQDIPVDHKTARANWLLWYFAALEALGEARMGGLRGDGLAPLLAPALLAPFGEDEDTIAAHARWVEERFWPELSQRQDIAGPVIDHFRALLRDYMGRDDEPE